MFLSELNTLLKEREVYIYVRPHNNPEAKDRVLLDKAVRNADNLLCLFTHSITEPERMIVFGQIDIGGPDVVVLTVDPFAETWTYARRGLVYTIEGIDLGHVE